MNEEIDYYFQLLYPNLQELPAEERYNAQTDKNLIYEHIEKIHRRFEDRVSQMERIGEAIDEQEIMQEIFKGVRRDYYYKLLYPNVRELPAEARYNAQEDKSFIYNHIEEIHRKFGNYVSQMERTGEAIDEQEIMQEIFKGVRRDYYYKLLYPNVRELPAETRYNAQEDKSFIYNHIEEIHRKFEDYVSQMERTGEAIDKQAIIQEIISQLKIRQFTKEQIGKATVNVPTTAKKEAEQIEIAENTRDNEKEGEEVGDDK